MFPITRNISANATDGQLLNVKGVTIGRVFEAKAMVGTGATQTWRLSSVFSLHFCVLLKRKRVLLNECPRGLFLWLHFAATRNTKSHRVTSCTQSSGSKYARNCVERVQRGVATRQVATICRSYIIPPFGPRFRENLESHCFNVILIL